MLNYLYKIKHHDFMVFSQKWIFSLFEWYMTKIKNDVEKKSTYELLTKLNILFNITDGEK